MTTTSSVPDLHGTATVNLPLQRAFEFFTSAMARWWPNEYHIGQADMVDTVLEPRVGGRWYERGADGSQCDWGRVLAWEPPDRLVVTWQINGPAGRRREQRRVPPPPLPRARPTPPPDRPRRNATGSWPGQRWARLVRRGVSAA